MSNMSKANQDDFKNSLVHTIATMVKDIQAIPDMKLRESLRIGLCRLLDLTFSQYADCFELIRQMEDLLADLSLDSTATVFEIECKLKELAGPLTDYIGE